MRILLDAIRTFGRSAFFLGAVSLLVSPLRAVIESDVVGYTQLELKQGLNLVSCSFDGLDSKAQHDLQDFFSGPLEEGDEIMFYDADSGYTTYRYSHTLWDADFNPVARPGWGDSDYIVASRPVVAGDAFWLNVKSAKTLTVAGRVRVTDQTIQCKPGLNLIAAAFPVPVDVNTDLSVSTLSPGDTLKTYLSAEESGAYKSYVYDYLYDSETFEQTKTPMWGTLDYLTTDVIIPKNASFWISVQKPTTITIKAPKTH